MGYRDSDGPCLVWVSLNSMANILSSRRATCVPYSIPTSSTRLSLKNRWKTFHNLRIHRHALLRSTHRSSFFREAVFEAISLVDSRGLGFVGPMPTDERPAPHRPVHSLLISRVLHATRGVYSMPHESFLRNALYLRYVPSIIFAGRI